MAGHGGARRLRRIRHGGAGRRAVSPRATDAAGHRDRGVWPAGGAAALAGAARGGRGHGQRAGDGRRQGVAPPRRHARACRVPRGLPHAKAPVDPGGRGRRRGPCRRAAVRGANGPERSGAQRGRAGARAADSGLVRGRQRGGAAALHGRAGRAGGAGTGRRGRTRTPACPGGAGAHRPRAARRGRPHPRGDHRPGRGGQAADGQATGGGQRGTGVDRDDRPDRSG